MCGIVAYVGHRPACDVVVDALRRMEYRGYDSSGLAILGDGGLTVRRRAGRLANLEEHWPRPIRRRWSERPASATPLERPTAVPPTATPPTRDAAAGFAIVHNGIIGNFAALRSRTGGVRGGVRQ